MEEENMIGYAYCKTCGKLFETKERSWYCSKKCYADRGKVNKHNEAIVKKAREILHKRDEYKCAYCGAKPGGDTYLCIDHIRPHSMYRNNKFNNLVTCCVTCNLRKGSIDLPKDEYWDVVGTLNHRTRKNLTTKEKEFASAVLKAFYDKTRTR